MQKIKRETPLCVAAMKGYSGVVELLLIAGANVNVDVLAETSFNFVFEVGSKVKVFYKGNINLAKRLGQAPLHIAVMENHTEGVELLLKRGADVNAVDETGKTPLKTEIAHDLIDIAKILIKYIILCDYHTTKPSDIVNNSELSKFWDFRKNEVSGRLSNSTITVYQFLREADENKLLGYFSYKNSNLMKYLGEKQYDKDFPIYANIITGQLHKAMKRKDLLYRSDIVMNHSVDLKDFPQEMKSEITNYLTNEELRNVIRAPFSILSQNLHNPSAEQLQADAQARN